MKEIKRCPICKATLTCTSFYNDVGRCYGSNFHKYEKNAILAREHVTIYDKNNKYVLTIQNISSYIYKYYNVDECEFFATSFKIDIFKFVNDPGKTFKRIKASQIFS